MKVKSNIGCFAAQVPMIHGELSEPEPSALVIKLTPTPAAAVALLALHSQFVFQKRTVLL